MSSADSPTRQLARIKNGQAVGVLQLPDRSRILADGTVCGRKKLLVVRLNKRGAFCWKRTQYRSSIDTYAKRAEKIETASSRKRCDSWPYRYHNLGGDGA